MSSLTKIPCTLTSTWAPTKPDSLQRSNSDINNIAADSAKPQLIFFLSIPPFKHQYCDEIIKTLLHPDSYTERHQKKVCLTFRRFVNDSLQNPFSNHYPPLSFFFKILPSSDRIFCVNMPSYEFDFILLHHPNYSIKHTVVKWLQGWTSGNEANTELATTAVSLWAIWG